MSSLANLLKISAIYTTTSGITGLLTMGTFFMLARSLTAAELGYIELFISMVPLLAALAESGILSALSYYYYASEDETARRRYVSVAHIFQTAASVLIILALLLLKDVVCRFLELPPDAGVYLFFFLLIFALEIQFGFCRDLFRLRIEYKRSAAMMILRNLVIFSAVLYFYLVVGEFNVRNYFLVLCCGILLPVILMFGKTGLIPSEGFDTTVFRRMFKYGRPLLFSAAAIYFINYADRLIIQKLSTTTELGYYAVAFKVAAISGLAIQGFQSAWAPIMLKSTLREGDLDLPKKSIAHYLFITLVIFFCVSCLAHEIIWILAGKMYLRSSGIVVFLVMSIIAFGAYDILHSGIVLGKRLIFHAICMITAGAVNLALNILFVTWWGIKGAALATALSSILSVAMAYFFSQRISPLPFPGRKILAALIVVSISGIVLYQCALAPFVTRVALLLLGLILTGLLFPTEASAFRNHIREKFNSFANGFTNQ